MWRVVVCFDRCACRLLVWSGPAEISFDDLRIAVTPLAFDSLHAISRGQIDYGVWLALRNVGRRLRKRNTNGCKQQNQAGESARIHLPPPLIAAIMLSAPTLAMSSSSCGELPLTPTAPMTLPSMIIGTPPFKATAPGS